MKPHELVAALVRKSGERVAGIARQMHSQSFQGTLHKFISGNVAQPSRTTAKRIADHFSINIDALYDERVARQEAIRLQLIPGTPQPLTTGAPTAPLLMVREPASPSYPALAPANPATRPALSRSLQQRLALLNEAQLAGVERLIHAHLDALGIAAGQEKRRATRAAAR